MIGDRWNVTAAEVAATYPCDEYVPNPSAEAWRGVTVQAQPADVWPWIAQIRLAPYSYDNLDNLGRRSPQKLVDLKPPAVGDPFTTAATLQLGGILSVEEHAHITGQIAGAVISYVLVPDARRTRLLMKIVTDRGGPYLAPLLVLGDLVMARRQLLNLKHLAEKQRL